MTTATGATFSPSVLMPTRYHWQVSIFLHDTPALAWRAEKCESFVLFIDYIPLPLVEVPL